MRSNNKKKVNTNHMALLSLLCYGLCVESGHVSVSVLRGERNELEQGRVKGCERDEWSKREDNARSERSSFMSIRPGHL